MSFTEWFQQYNKAWVGLIMTAAFWLNSKYGFNLPVDEATATTIFGVLTSALVYLVPNKKLGE